MGHKHIMTHPQLHTNLVFCRVETEKESNYLVFNEKTFYFAKLDSTKTINYENQVIYYSNFGIWNVWINMPCSICK